MDENSQITLFSLAMIGLGLLALKLPYRFNPFRFKRLVAGFLSENANRRVPKVFGWLLIAFGGFGLLVMLLQFGLNRHAESAASATANSSRKFAETMMAEEAALTTAVSKGVADADHFDLLLRDSQSGRFKDTLMNEGGPALAELKKVFSGQPVAPRNDRSHALFLTPASAITFKRDGVQTVQIQLSGNLGAFNAVVEEIEEIYQNLLPAENVRALQEALPQLARP